MSSEGGVAAKQPSQQQPKRKRNRRRNARPSKGGPPPAPQTKLMVRDIREIISVSSIVQSFAHMIQMANDKLDCKMQLDPSSLRTAIESDHLARKARKEWETNNNIQKESEEEHSEAGEEDISALMENLKVSTTDSPLGARLLYVVPPRKTSRRGDRPGSFYIVLWTKAIANKMPAQQKSEEPAAEVATEGTTPPSQQPLPDYSQEVLQRYQLLLRATEALEYVVDSKSKSWSGWKLIEAPNSKTLRPLPPGKLEGTIFETPAYKEYLESQNASKEAIRNRPKPAPGGGMSAAMGLEMSGENTEKVSALVKQIQARREQEKKKKAKRKKKGNETKKGGKNKMDSAAKSRGKNKAPAGPKKPP